MVCSPDRGVVEALAAEIVAAQGGDVLAPVEVVVQTGLAGVTLRRAATGPRGLANVRFSSLPQLAERLCARQLALAPGPLRRPLTPADRSRALQQVLTSPPGDGPLRRAAQQHRATAGLLEAVFAELDGAQIRESAEPKGLSGRGQEVLELYRRYRAQVADLLSSAELLDLAARSVTDGTAPISSVILVASGPLDPPAKRLFTALHAAGRLTAVLPPGHNPHTAQWLRDQFDHDETAEAVEPPPAVARLLVAPDAEEEVRIAVRTTLNHLATSSCRPERIGIAYRSINPYPRLLAEQLTVAGVPHHVPSQRTLAQTVAGRTVQGLLSLHQRGFPRADVLRWMADGPIIDVEGNRLPAARWDRLSREAGASRALDTWRLRLTRYADDQRNRALDLPDDATDTDERRVRLDAKASDALALLAEVENLHEIAGTALAATTWPAVAEHLAGLLRRTLGSRRRVDGWSARASDQLAQQVGLEQGAFDAVATLLQSLSGLEVPVDPATIIDTLADGLSAPVPSGTTLGRGVLVGTLRSFVGADLDVLLVLGATEDALPARQRESPVLRDADRVLLSPELATVASRRAAEREHWNSALASAKAVHVSYPRADTRSQRRQFPSPWFLEQAQLLNARADAKPINSAQVDGGRVDAPWFAAYESFDASLRHATTFASAHELDVAFALHGRVDDLAATDPRLARGLQAARSRARGEFDEWSGNTGVLREQLRSSVDTHLSASTLQTWATCPTSHLYRKFSASETWKTAPVRTPSTPGTRGSWSTVSSRSCSPAISARWTHQASIRRPPGPKPIWRRPLRFSRPTPPPSPNAGSPAATCCGSPSSLGCDGHWSGYLPWTAHCAAPDAPGRSRLRPPSGATGLTS